MSLTDPLEAIPDDPHSDEPAVEKPEQIPAGTLVPALNGGMIRHGSQPGTNRGGSGRPPKPFKEYCRDLTDDPELRESIRRRALKQATVLKYVLDHGAGVPDVNINMQHSADPGALERLFAKLAPPADPALPTADPVLPPADEAGQ